MYLRPLCNIKRGRLLWSLPQSSCTPLASCLCTSVSSYSCTSFGGGGGLYAATEVAICGGGGRYDVIMSISNVNVKVVLNSSIYDEGNV